MRRPRHPAALLGSLLLASSVTTVTLAAGTRNLLSPTAFSLTAPGDGATLAWTSPPDAPKGAGRVLRITVTKPAEPFYLLSTGQTLSQGIANPTRLRLSFWGRSPTRNPLRLVLEKAGPPYTGFVELSPTLTPQWRQYAAMDTVQPFRSGDLQVRLQFGHQAGTLELAGLSLTDAGPDPDLVAAQAALAPAAIRQRIERYRKGTMVVEARDARGRPVPGAKVSVRQQKHAFLFGCNLFGLDPANRSDAQKAYQTRFTDLLNYCTLPFYWGAFEPQQGQPQYARLDAMAKWARAHGLESKGHPLVWHEVWPRWAPQDADAAIPLLRQRVKSIIPHFRGLVRYWDVQNEAISSTSFPRTGVGQWAQRDGAPAMVRTTLGWAREAARGTGDVLLYNDYDTSERCVALLEDLRKHRALPDVIGIQSHMHGGNWPLATVWQRTQRFARFGLPIHFTEVTVLSGEHPTNLDMSHPPANWPSTPAGEEEQARYLEGFYQLLFSHPAVRAITYWDLSDAGSWMGAPSGLVRRDMSPKPAYQRLMKLIHGDWWTRANGATGRGGRYSTRAFYGTHQVTVTDRAGHSATVKVELPMGSGSRTVRVTLAG